MALVNSIRLAFAASVPLISESRLDHALESAPNDIPLLLALPTATLVTYMLPFARDRWWITGTLIATLTFQLLLTGVFTTSFTPGLALFGCMALLLGWLVTIPAKDASTNGAKLHLTDLGAHWVKPGVRPRFAPWDDIQTRCEHDRLIRTGDPGEQKAFTLKLPLSTHDHSWLQQTLGRRI